MACVAHPDGRKSRDALEVLGETVHQFLPVSLTHIGCVAPKSENSWSFNPTLLICRMKSSIRSTAHSALSRNPSCTPVFPLWWWTTWCLLNSDIGPSGSADNLSSPQSGSQDRRISSSSDFTCASNFSHAVGELLPCK